MPGGSLGVVVSDLPLVSWENAGTPTEHSISARPSPRITCDTNLDGFEYCERFRLMILFITAPHLTLQVFNSALRVECIASSLKSRILQCHWRWRRLPRST